MPIKSYLQKTFLVENSEARIRKASNLLAYELYVVGDVLPAGKRVGRPKVIPKGTRLKISNAKSLASKLTFVFTESAESNGVECGWTSADNLAGKFLNETIGQRLPATDENKKGPNAVWQNGWYVEQAVLIEIVGNYNETELIVKKHLDAYLEMVEEARRSGVEITLTSGFRSYPEQLALYTLYSSNPRKFALAAQPGRSNHQNGIAFDFGVGGFDGNPVYDWLKTHGPEFCFIRTVNREPWHWEYRPSEALALTGSGKFN